MRDRRNAKASAELQRVCLREASRARAREETRGERERERERERMSSGLGFVSRPCACFDPLGRGHFSHASPRSQAFYPAEVVSTAPQPLFKEARERDAVAGGLLLSGQLNHRKRITVAAKERE